MSYGIWTLYGWVLNLYQTKLYQCQIFIYFFHITHTSQCVSQTHTHTYIFILFVHRNWWGPSNQPYDWGQDLSAQMDNETNLCAEESWAVRTRNGGGSSWCGCAFSKFPVQLSCLISTGLTDFHFTLDNFMPLVSVLC